MCCVKATYLSAGGSTITRDFSLCISCLPVGGGVLKVCALRLAGVYGEGEQRHLPRIVVRSAMHSHTYMCKACVIRHSVA